VALCISLILNIALCCCLWHSYFASLPKGKNNQNEEPSPISNTTSTPEPPRLVYRNPSYEMFYGEWKATERIYINPEPIRGMRYTEDEMAKMMDRLIANGITKETFHFTAEKVVINGNETLKDIQYIHTVFPANDNKYITIGTSLKDIGLTENRGAYFALIEVKSEEHPHFDGCWFFIKDKDTLIVFKRGYHIEYDRVSYEGGSEDFGLIP